MINKVKKKMFGCPLSPILKIGNIVFPVQKYTAPNFHNSKKGFRSIYLLFFKKIFENFYVLNVFLLPICFHL